MSILLERFGFVKQNRAQKYLKSLRLRTKERLRTNLAGKGINSLGNATGAGAACAACTTHRRETATSQLVSSFF